MSKRLLVFVFAFLPVTFLQAQQKVIQLYDGPAPGSESWNWKEGENDNNQWQTKVVYNITKPTLTIFQPEAGKANGTAVIIAPGGGFHALSINSEGFDVAKWLVQKGVTCFVLKYRLIHVLSNDPTAEFAGKMGKKEFDEDVTKVLPLCIADGRNAIAYVRNHAVEYNLDANKIGIMGFSAGGTVASSTLFNYTKENRPDFAAPVYPFFPSNMIGDIANDAPPIFIVAATDDGFGLAPHSVELYNKWLSTKHDAELHLYARGNHGFGMKKQNLPTDNWIERFNDWLGVQGLLTKKVSNPLFDIYQKKELATGDGKTLSYRILLPENYDKTKKYPVVLFLHGSGERGSDNEKQLTHGAKLFIADSNRKSFPAIVIFPQCPSDSSWSSVKFDRSKTPLSFSFDYTMAQTWAMKAVINLLKQVSSEEGADQSRIYITGLSMGGFGTFEAVYQYPNIFAAAMPICGGGDTEHYDKRVKKIPFWIFHGAADAVVNVENSRAMVKKLQSLHLSVKYNEYPGVNHNSWDNAFAEPDYLSWMFSQKRK